MKALMLKQPRSLVMQETERPECPEGWALVKTFAVSVCGSDFHSYRGENALLTYPRIMGHEVCGVIESINGNAKPFHIGQKVILMPYLGCGSCIACRKGKENCCSSLSVYGVHRDGAMATWFCAPLDHLLAVDENLEPKIAALVEPLSISTHAVERGNIEAGMRILVAGSGPIGMGVALMARLRGADVAIADTDAARRTFARNVFGFEQVFDPRSSSFEKQVSIINEGEGPDVIIDSTGNNKSMERTVSLLSNGGRLVFVGISSKPIALDGTEFHKRETELFDSRAAFRSDFQQVLSAMESGRLDPRPMITHGAPFSQSDEAFVEWNDLGGNVFKAVMDMTE